MHLLVDLGNTRLKWAAADPGWKVGAAVLQGREIDELLDDVWRELPAPGAAVIVSVAPPSINDAIAQWARSRWRIGVHWVQPQAEQLGVVNRYRDPATLGADRWAALIGARAAFPQSGVCVVDCGTAATIDALTAVGDFAGGVIFPGLGLLRRALTAGTAHIRAGEGEELSCLARATGDAVAAGTLYGLTGAIERVYHEFEQALEEPMKLVITGGDADRVAARLTRPARRVPDLVLRGLDRIAQTL
jgi:type III pantothenate kinase